MAAVWGLLLLPVRVLHHFHKSILWFSFLLTFSSFFLFCRQFINDAELSYRVHLVSNGENSNWTSWPQRDLSFVVGLNFLSFCATLHASSPPNPFSLSTRSFCWKPLRCHFSLEWRTAVLPSLWSCCLQAVRKEPGTRGLEMIFQPPL